MRNFNPLQFNPFHLVGLILLTLTCPAGAEGFSRSIALENHNLTRAGSGTLRFKGILPVYDATLYLHGSEAAGQVLEDVPKRLEVIYRVSVKAERFNQAGESVLRKNLDADSFESIRERLDRINSWYPDPQKGDRCAIQYIPGQGTQLFYNEQLLGSIPGPDFAQHYFGIWLGEEPACKRLRQDLLKLR